jgi:hypothetical protein
VAQPLLHTWRAQLAASAPREITRFLGAFLCVFAGLALLRGPGPIYARAHAEVANVLVDGLRFSSGERLHFEAPKPNEDPWRVTLHIAPVLTGPRADVPIDLRSLVFLPTAAFIGLAIAVSLRSVREHLLLLATGLLILEPLCLALVALPLLSFLGGTGPIRVFSLSRPIHVVLQVLYRGLVAPPGMAYAVPLFVWWLLLSRLIRGSAARLTPSSVPS